MQKGVHKIVATSKSILLASVLLAASVHAQVPKPALTERSPASAESNQQFVKLFLQGEFADAWRLVNQGVDMEAPLLSGGLTPVEYAALNGLRPQLEFLNQFNVKSLDAGLIMALSRYAVGNATARAPVLTQLFKMGANPQAVDRLGRSAMYWAARADDEEGYLRLLQRGGVPDLYSQLMLCPVATPPVTVRRFLGNLETTCVCPPGADARMETRSGQFNRACVRASDGAKVGIEVTGRLAPAVHPAHWGDWHPTVILSAKMHQPNGAVAWYQCANQSCKRVVAGE